MVTPVCAENQPGSSFALIVWADFGPEVISRVKYTGSYPIIFINDWCLHLSDNGIPINKMVSKTYAKET